MSLRLGIPKNPTYQLALLAPILEGSLERLAPHDPCSPATQFLKIPRYQLAPIPEGSFKGSSCSPLATRNCLFFSITYNNQI